MKTGTYEENVSLYPKATVTDNGSDAPYMGNKNTVTDVGGNVYYLRVK